MRFKSNHTWRVIREDHGFLSFMYRKCYTNSVNTKKLKAAQKHARKEMAMSHLTEDDITIEKWIKRSKRSPKYKKGMYCVHYFIP